MLRKSINGMLVAILLLPLHAGAAGLGRMVVHSSLGERLDAEVELVGVAPGEAAALKVALASPADFKRVGVDRGFYLSALRFGVREEAGGRAYVAVTSVQPVKEPLLDFLLELSGPEGRVLKEFTVFLDPPSRPAGAKSVVAAPSVAPPARVERESTAAAAGAHGADVMRLRAGAGEYGPTQIGDTLWGIARRYAAAAEGADINQVMVAILRANPDAFLDGNANGLMAGRVLRIPEAAELAAVPATQARQTLAQQQQQWQQRGAQVAAPDSYAEGVVERTPGGEESGTEAGATQERASVRLIRGESGDAADEQGGELTEHLLTLEESLDSQRQENEELLGRIAELEAQLATVQKMMGLQQQAAKGQTADQEQTAPSPGVDQGSGTETAAPAGPEMGEDVAAGNPEQETPDAPVAEGSTEPGPADQMEQGASEEEAVSAPSQGAGTDHEQDAGDENGGAAGEALEATQGAQPVAAPQGGDTTGPGEQQGSTTGIDVTPAVPGSGSGGLLDWVFGNIKLIGVGILVLILGAIGWVFASRRGSEGTDLLDEPESAAPAEPATQPVDEPELDTTAVVGVAESDETTAPPEIGTTTASLEVDSEATMPAGTGFTAAVSDAEIEDVDPIAEADVYLAYGRHEQAEEILKEAVQYDPERQELKLKLLEIYFQQKNVAEFDAVSEQLQPLAEQDPATWEKVKAMGAQLNADNPLYAGAAELGADINLVAGADSGQDVLDLGDVDDASASSDDPSDFMESLDLDDDSDSVSGEDSTSINLDDITGGTDSAEPGLTETMVMEAPPAQEAPSLKGAVEPAGDETDTGVDFDSDDISGALPADEGGVEQAVTIDDDMSLEFDVDALDHEETAESLQDQEGDAGDDDGMVLDFDLGVGAEDEPSAVEDAPDTDASLDLTLDQPLPSAETGGETREDEAEATAAEDDDFSIEFSVDDLDDAGEPDDAASPAAAGDSEPGLEETMVGTAPGQADDASATFDDSGTIPTLDAVASKLDLMAAYVEMGDAESAARVMDEVRERGSEEQIAQGEELLRQLDG